MAELERQRGMTPNNSSPPPPPPPSPPPSSQHPHAKPTRTTKGKAERKRGGQPGHKQHERTLVPPEQVDETAVLRPGACRRRGQRLAGAGPEPWRHQVWELPEIKPFITEYQRHRLTCSCCGTSSCAALPAGVPQHQSGPRLTAFVALLTAHFRQSKRRGGLFCESVLNIPCSAGLAVKRQNRATIALRPSGDELARALPAQPVLGIDEPPTKQSNRKAWLWAFVAEGFTLFRVRDSRNAEILDERLTEDFTSTVTCGRAKRNFRLPNL